MGSVRALHRAALAATLVAVGARPALAEDRALAQQLFEEARALMARGNYVDACPKLDGAAKLVATPGVRLNLADCYEHVGRFASAWTAFDDAAAAAERLGDATAAREAATGKTRVAPKRAFLVIAAREPDTAGLEVRRDGVTVPKVAWGSPTPIDPGEHAVEAAATGRRPWSRKVTIPPGAARETVEVPPLARDETTAAQATAPRTSEPARTSAPPAPPGGAPAAPTQSSGRWMTAIAASASVGLVGVGIGAYFAAQSHAKSSDAEALCPGGVCTAKGASAREALSSRLASLDSQASSAGRSAVVSFALGGAGLGTAAVLLLVRPSTSRPAQVGSVRIAPWVTPELVGVTGSF